MITTVTISTVTTITTAIGLGVTLGLVAVVTLLLFLGARELASVGAGTDKGNPRRFLVRSFSVGIIPLIIVFVVIVLIKVMEILGWI